MAQNQNRGEYRGLIYRNHADLAAWLAKRPREKVLEPDLPIIDPHHHLWDAPQRQRELYLLTELLADVHGKDGGGHNIVSTVFLECQAMFRAHGPDEMKPLGEIEFVRGIADGSVVDGAIRLPSALIQPIASDDVADAVAEAALAAPLNGVVEIGGPDAVPLDELIRQAQPRWNDTRAVITDPKARYFGAELAPRTLVPDEGSKRGLVRFATWQR